MTSPSSDGPVPLTELARFLRRRDRPNKRLDVKVLYRWAFKGLSGERLLTVSLEGRVCSTVCWLAEFLQKTGANRWYPTRRGFNNCLRRTSGGGTDDGPDDGAAPPVGTSPRDTAEFGTSAETVGTSTAARGAGGSK